jgi:hypothetical protein
VTAHRCGVVHEGDGGWMVAVVADSASKIDLGEVVFGGAD